jgi:hypothetical protein
MSTNWKVAAAASALGVGVLVVLTTIGHGLTSPGSGKTSSSAAAVVTIDSSVGETFTPGEYPVDAGYLSANAVWQKWDNEQLPDTIPASYGSLTLLDGPPDDPQTTAKESGTPVWAFQERNYCLPRTGGALASPSTTSPTAETQASTSATPSTSASSGPADTSCTTWDFFDAQTGAHIDSYSVSSPSQ